LFFLIPTYTAGYNIYICVVVVEPKKRSLYTHTKKIARKLLVSGVRITRMISFPIEKGKVVFYFIFLNKNIKAGNCFDSARKCMNGTPDPLGHS
jgi:hypothetical protein